MTFTEKEIENIMLNSFKAGICYGAALSILQDKYSQETIIIAAKEFMETMVIKVVK